MRFPIERWLSPGAREGRRRYIDRFLSPDARRCLRGSSKGPRKWCHDCSRYHRSREVCRLYLRDRRSKSGRKVKVWAH